MSTEAAKRGTRRAIIAIETLVGAAAIGAGFLFIARPNGSLMGMSTGSLSRTPFIDYRVPGILLVAAIGGGTLGAAVSVARRARDAAEMVLISGVMLVLFELVEEALIGYNPQQAVVTLVGLILVALSLRLAGPMMPADVVVTGDRLVVRFPGASALLAFRKPLEVPFGHIVGAERAGASEVEPRRGFLFIGQRLPSSITAGRARHQGGRVFCNVSDPGRAITISLRNERYARLIVDVAEPDRTLAAVREALADQSRTAA